MNQMFDELERFAAAKVYLFDWRFSATNLLSNTMSGIAQGVGFAIGIGIVFAVAVAAKQAMAG
jgi:hypothetical protein